MEKVGGREQLIARVRAIAFDHLRRAEPLPSEPVLADELGVSRPALREALARLEGEGLLRRRRGADTVTNPGALDLPARFDQQVEFADLLRSAGFEPAMEVVSSDVVRLSDREASELDCRRGTPALRTVKRWRANGTVVMLAVDKIPSTTPLQHAPSAEMGLFELVRALGGDTVAWELAYPGATALTPWEAGLLDQPVNAPVLTLDLVGIGHRGQRLYLARELHVPGAVRFGLIRNVVRSTA